MMISYKDIKKAVNSKLEKEFGVEINSNDVKEGFNRPSFFVSFDNQTRSSDTSQVQKVFTVQINYFPSDRYDYSLELLDMQEQLENLFDLKLKVSDRYLNIIEPSTIETDGVLNFSFDIDFYEGRESTFSVDGEELNTELMQTLEIDIKKG